jgi:hypothetical protein
MIITEFYNGQGLGNQLWCYFVIRSLSAKLGIKYGIMSPEKFKGTQFLNIDFGEKVLGGVGPEGGPPDLLPTDIRHYYRERISLHPTKKVNISKMDPGMYQIEDSTKIDGCMQSLEYLDKNIDLNEWIYLKEDKEIIDYQGENVCIIHVRGGDFMGSSSILGQNYYRNSIKKMEDLNPLMKFYVVTDDVNYSRSILPDIEIIGGSSLGIADDRKASHHIGGPIWMDWSIIYNAQNVIISSSSFSFWPAFLNNKKQRIIAPMYWGDPIKSDGYWSCWDMIVEGWSYLDQSGNLLSSSECEKNREKYEKDKEGFLW